MAQPQFDTPRGDKHSHHWWNRYVTHRVALNHFIASMGIPALVIEI